MGRKTCMKCGKGADVLVCKGSICPVVIHESCIPGSVQVSDRENFYCPHCMYKQSVAEFQQAREKALLARRKMSAFMGAETPGGKEFEPNTTRYNRRMPQNHDHFGNRERAGEGKEGSHSMRIENDATGGERNLVDTSETSSRDGLGLSTVDIGGTSSHDGLVLSTVDISGTSSHDGLDLSTVDEKGRSIRQCEGGPKVYECTNGIKMVGNQKNSHLFSKMVDAMRACERRTTNVQYLSPMPLSVAVGGVIQHYVCVNEWHEDGSSEIPEQPERGGKIYVSGNHRAEIYGSIARHSIQNKLHSKRFILPGKACDNPSGDEVYRCDDNNVMNCSTPGGIDNPGKRSLFGVPSDTRRKRLRWTNEEEDILKKGVLVHSTGVKKNLPWRKILEFGRHVFDGSRSPTDLKAKWKLTARKVHLQSNDEEQLMRACERRTTDVEYLSPMPLSVAVGGVVQHNVCVNEWYEDGSSVTPEQPECGACDNPPGDEVYRCDDNKIMNCSTAGGINNPGKRSPFGVASDTRRKRLRWTNEEEDILKKGVLVYSKGVKKNLPWRKILEFGRHVFDGSRSPTDLKTKWKLIARKEHLQSYDE